MTDFIFDLQMFADYFYVTGTNQAITTATLEGMSSNTPTWVTDIYYLRITTSGEGVITSIETGASAGAAEPIWAAYTGTIGDIDDNYKKFGTREATGFKLTLDDVDGVEVANVVEGDSFDVTASKTLKVGTETYTAGTGGANFKGIVNGANPAAAILYAGSIAAETSAQVTSVTVHVGTDSVDNGTVMLEAVTSGEAVTAEIASGKATSILKGSKLTTTVTKYDFETANLQYHATTSATGTESWDGVTIDGNVFKGGDTTGETGLKISRNGTTYSVTDGTAYLSGTTALSVKAGESATTEVSVTGTTDVTVNVTTSAITVGDVDNGESFKIGSKTYTVENGTLKADGTAVSEVETLASGKAFTISFNGTGEYSSTTQVDNVNKSGASTTPEGNKDVNGINFVVSGDALGGSSVTVKEFNNNDYLHKNGTVDSSSKDAVGQFKYNSTTGVITYTPTDKTKAQNIDFANGESTKYKFNVSGTNAADTIKGENGEHTINGGSGNDIITAGESNTVIGGAGNDFIDGATKASLNGGAGNDTLRGGAETTLVGSDGADTFVLREGENLGSGFISDYKLDQNDVILADNVNTQADLRNAATDENSKFGADGVFSLSGTGAVTLDGSKGYYAVNVKAKDGKTQLFGWAGEKATKIDASSLKDDVILLGNTNSEADSLYGGSGNDTIYAGAGDTVYGAAGKNTLVLDGVSNDDLGVTVGVGKGKDTITKFVEGFDSEKSDKLTIVGGLSSIGSTLDNKILNLKSGDASVVMTGANDFGDTVKLLVNGKKAVFAAAGATVSVGSATYADFYLGSKASNGDTSILDASAIEESVSIDLSNTNVFRNFNQVTGGKGKTTLIGSNGNDTLTAGEGATSLYGGAGKDSLVGSSSTEVRDTFFMMAGAGSDTISNFTVFNGENVDTADIVNFSAIQSAKHVTGGAQINVNDTDKVLIENVNVDDAIGYQVGNSINAAKLGDVSNENNFTYLKGVNYYGGGNKVDTVAFTSGDSDNHEIWLDGSKGVSYASIDVVDGSNAAGDLILAGDSAKNTIVGGSGNNSLWGGAGNTADVLTGNGSKNTFFYGLAEGNDTITCGSENDLVNLYNIGLSDVTKAEITDSGVSLEFIDGAKVSVDTGYRDVKFALKDGSTWTANHNTHQWNS